MAGELQYPVGIAGLDVYARVTNDAGQVWTDPSFSTPSGSTWAASVFTDLVDAEGSGRYKADAPSGSITAGGTRYEVRLRTVADEENEEDMVVWEDMLVGTVVTSADITAATANGGQIATDQHQYNARTVIKGDSYGSSARSFIVTIQDGSEWPTDLTSYTLAFSSSLNADNDNAGSALTGTVSLVTATGDSRAVRVTLTSAVTSAAAVGEHDYAVRASLTGGIDWTLELGTITVKGSPAEA